MKILIVGMARSIHTARWINQFRESGWEIHLFPSFDNGTSHPILCNTIVHHSFYSPKDNLGSNLKLNGISIGSKKLSLLFRILLKRFFPKYREQQLSRVILQIKPDVIHSLVVDTGGYLTLQSKNTFVGKFPPWIVTNYGNDLFFYGRLAEYKPKMLAVLKSCKYFCTECERDKFLAINEYNFTGKVYSTMYSVGGGWDLKSVQALRNQIKPSDRKIILVKGYQHLRGRAYVALRALERCKDILDGYTIVIFGADPIKDISFLGEWFTFNTGISVIIEEQTNDYDSILKLQSSARVTIGLSITDGVSNSFLEALIMGSFPIQSVSSNTSEWITDGITGFGVPPEDPEVIEKAIRIALADDKMVNSAAVRNWETVSKRLDEVIMYNKAVEMYNDAIRLN